MLNEILIKCKCCTIIIVGVCWESLSWLQSLNCEVVGGRESCPTTDWPPVRCRHPLLSPRRDLLTIYVKTSCKFAIGRHPTLN